MTSIMRDTSLIAYQELLDSGKINAQERVILDAVGSGADYSLQEIVLRSGLPINAVSGRCFDLKKKGLLEEGERRKCRVTQRTIRPVRVAA